MMPSFQGANHNGRIIVNNILIPNPILFYSYKFLACFRLNKVTGLIVSLLFFLG